MLHKKTVKLKRVIERKNNRIKAIDNKRDVMFCSSGIKTKDKIIKGQSNSWYLAIVEQINNGCAKLVCNQSDKDRCVYEVDVEGKRVKAVYNTKSKRVVTSWFI